MLNNIYHLKNTTSLYTIALVLATCAFSSHAADLGLKQRPEKLRDAIHQRYEEVTQVKGWSYNGAVKYSILGLNEDDIVLNMVNSNPDQKVYTFMDVGSGNHAWAEARVKFINEAFNHRSDLHFNIFSITGDNYENANTIVENGVKVDIKNEGLCSVYNLSTFPIENMTEKFAELGYLDMLSNQVDWAVAAYTLFHLVDPIGTFFRLHDLMRLSTGIMLIENMFRMSMHDMEPTQEFLAHTNLEFFRPASYHSFAVRRSQHSNGWFPYAYKEGSDGCVRAIAVQYENNIANPKNTLAGWMGDNGSDSLGAWLRFKAEAK